VQYDLTAHHAIPYIHENWKIAPAKEGAGVMPIISKEEFNL
jgi:hypothetical protein